MIAESALTRLGADVERLWAATRFDPVAFTEIARAELLRRRLHARFALPSLLTRLLAPSPLPETTVTFEEPADAPVFPLYGSDRVAVDLHLYCPSMTTIHDHDFDAAIVNLEGQSLLSTFAFDEPRPAAKHVQTGQLRLLRVERMPRGAIEVVHAGPRTIHRVTHLAARTTMLVVRARSPRLARARVRREQHVYLSGWAGGEGSKRGQRGQGDLAVRVFGRTERGRPACHDARAKMLGFLAATDPRAAHVFLVRLLRTGDAWSTLSTLLDNWDYLAETGDLEPALRASRRRLGPWVGRLPAAQRCLRQIAQVPWTLLQGEDERLLAALRLTLGDRARENAWAAAHAPDLDVPRTSRRLSRARQLTP